MKTISSYAEKAENKQVFPLMLEWKKRISFDILDRIENKGYKTASATA